MYVKFDNIAWFADNSQSFDGKEYPHDGTFLTFTPQGTYIVIIENGAINAHISIEKSMVIKDEELVPRKELDAADGTIKQLKAWLNERSSKEIKQSAISEETLLKVIEMFLQHQQTPQPYVVPTTTPNPFPPYEVWCKNDSKAATAENIQL